MGCDIHLYVETKKPDGSWGLVLPPKDTGLNFDKMKDMSEDEKDAYRKSVKEYRYEHSDDYYDRYDDEDPTGIRRLGSKARWFNQRHYELFSWLAGVRGSLEPVFEGRGNPHDASDDYKQIVASWGRDGHSHTYATLKEAREELNKRNSKVKRAGVLSCQQVDLLDREGICPDSWYGWTNSVTIISEAAYREFRDNGLIEVREDGNAPLVPKTHFINGKPIAVAAEWEDESNFSDFDELLTELEQLGEDPNNVRLVFFFDN